MTTKDNQISELQKSLEAKKTAVLNLIKEKHQDSLDFLQKNGLDLEELKENQINRLAAATATGVLLLSPGSMAAKELPNSQTNVSAGPDKDAALFTGAVDPGPMRGEFLKTKIGSGDEKEIEKFVQATFGIRGVYEQNGYRLNRNVGLIGAEQHLYRWPGDSLEQHLKTEDDRAMFGPSGIAPNRGAYGYFGAVGDPGVILRERYYFAIQTFLSPTWVQDTKGTYNFFRFKKLLAINTQTGQAVVGVVGDAGPAQWTGKSYGGSPEVMHYLGLGKGPRKGEILLLLVDDAENKVPLGPVTIDVGGA